MFFTAITSFLDDEVVTGFHPYKLQFARCPSCEVDRAADLEYPFVSAEAFTSAALLRKVTWSKYGMARWEEYKQYEQALRNALPEQFPITPGTAFGQWNGKVLSRKGCESVALMVVMLSTLLMERRTVELFKEENIPLTFFEIELRPLRDWKPDLVEVWTPPIGLSCPSSGVTLCKTCNRGTTYDFHCVNAATVPDCAHVFRLRDAPNRLVFSQAFVNVCEKHQLRGIKFEPVPHEADLSASPDSLLPPPPAMRGRERSSQRSSSSSRRKPGPASGVVFGDWLDRLRSFAGALAQVGGANVIFDVGRAATDDETATVNRKLNRAIPQSLHDFFKQARSVRLEYSLEEGLHSSFHLNLQHLASMHTDAAAWMRDTWIADDDEQMELWRGTFPFLQFPNGDFLGLVLVSGKSESSLRYLRHDDVCVNLANSFESFLDVWERLSYVGPELDVLEEFIDEDGCLSYEGEPALALRREISERSGLLEAELQRSR